MPKPVKPVSPLMRDFITLAKWEHHFDDHGPQNPLLAQLAKDLKLNQERRIWLALLGMGYYHEGSAWGAWQYEEVRNRTKLPPSNLPIGQLRRNLYGGRITKHFLSLANVHNLTAWATAPTTWEGLIEQCKTIWGNGKWASYTTAESLVHITPLDIAPGPEAFLSNPGPRKGIQSLGLPVTAQGVERLVAILANEGVVIPIQVLETVMCNWNNLLIGTFYIGRSLDRQQSRLIEVEREGVDCAVVWKARKTVFKHEALGELAGWNGLDRDRLKLYRDTGKLLLPWEGR